MEQLARRLTRAWYERGVIALLVLGAGFCLAIYLLTGINLGVDLPALGRLLMRLALPPLMLCPVAFAGLLTTDPTFPTHLGPAATLRWIWREHRHALLTWLIATSTAFVVLALSDWNRLLRIQNNPTALQWDKTALLQIYALRDLVAYLVWLPLLIHPWRLRLPARARQ
jgi:hypothetical protein